jgi:hypothetical protein
MGAYPTIRFGTDAPLPLPANAAIVQWTSMVSTNNPTQINALAYIQGDGNTSHFLRGDGVFASPTGASNNLSGYRRTGLVLVDGVSTFDTVCETINKIGSQGIAQSNIVNKQALAYQFESSTSNAFAGIYGSSSSGTANWFFGSNLNLWAEFYIGATTDIRVWCGLFDIAVSPTTIAGSDTLAANQYAAFRYSTAAGDTDVQCVTCDGSTQHVISSGVAMDTKSHKYLIVIVDGVSPSVQFYIDGVLVATSTSNLPSTVKAYYVCGCSDQGAAASIFPSGVVTQGDF